MERIKKCRYCQKKFTAKRIDARYCSDSCRQMGYRRDNYPSTYGKVVPIYFELDDYEYAKVLEEAQALEMHPNDYVKTMLTKKDNFLNVYFSDEDWSYVIVYLKEMFKDKSTEEIIRDIFLKAAEEEIANYKV